MPCHSHRYNAAPGAAHHPHGKLARRRLAAVAVLAPLLALAGCSTPPSPTATSGALRTPLERAPGATTGRPGCTVFFCGLRTGWQPAPRRTQALEPVWQHAGATRLEAWACPAPLGRDYAGILFAGRFAGTSHRSSHPSDRTVQLALGDTSNQRRLACRSECHWARKNAGAAPDT